MKTYKIDSVEITEDQLNKLIAQKEAGKEGRWRAEKGDTYFYIDQWGDAEDFEEVGVRGDDFRHKTHNYFKTREEAQNKLDLINHVYSFPMPEKGSFTYYVNCVGKFEMDKLHPFGSFDDYADYESGTIIHKDTTEEDREERIRLLKLVYGK